MWEEAEGEEEDGFLSIMKLIDCQDPETKKKKKIVLRVCVRVHL